ncbi:MAG: M15 family metallopeptidase [Candidatus Paceibacterota bacterium]
MKIILALFLLSFSLAPSLINPTMDQAQQEENERLAREEKKVYLMGRFDQTKREDFVSVSEKYSMGGSTMYLRKETYDAFIQMRKAALEDGITLSVASATRNFEYQKGLWNRKWNGVTFVSGQNLAETMPNELERFKKILEYSAAPGTSRHHWGTEIDINGADPAYFDTALGIKVYDWLSENAMEFGFCQTYNKKGANRLTGYNEEKWHWSYLPLAQDFTSEYKNIITETDIVGFLGEAEVPKLNLIENYVLAINPECL